MKEKDPFGFLLKVRWGWVLCTQPHLEEKEIYSIPLRDRFTNALTFLLIFKATQFSFFYNITFRIIKKETSYLYAARS